MLTHHTYFNLDAYKNPAQGLIWDHILSMPHTKRYLAADSGALPTGKILTADPGSINDFYSKPNLTLGHARTASGFKSNCGSGCEGYNGYYIFDDDSTKNASATVQVALASAWSGIKAELRTNQPGVVIYTCSWSDGTASLKKTQGTSSRKKLEKSSCVAIEAQDYVDGINQ